MISPEFALRLPHPDPGKWAAGALAVVVHALLATLLIFGVQWQTQPRETTVEVALYRAETEPAAETPAAPAPSAPALRPPEPRPVPKVESRPMPKLEPRPVPKVEPRPVPAKPDIAIKEKLPPKVVPKVQAKPEAQPAPKPEVKPTPKSVPHDYSKELESTENSLSSTKASLDAARELQGMKAAQAFAARGKAIKTWADRIAAKVKGNIVVPPGVTGNPQAKFDITLMSNGDVLSAKLHTTSGSPALDAAIERAIFKSSPLPLPEDKAVFQRELHFVFRPLEN